MGRTGLKKFPEPFLAVGTLFFEQRVALSLDFYDGLVSGVFEVCPAGWLAVRMIAWDPNRERRIYQAVPIQEDQLAELLSSEGKESFDQTQLKLHAYFAVHEIEHCFVALKQGRVVERKATAGPILRFQPSTELLDISEVNIDQVEQDIFCS